MLKAIEKNWPSKPIAKKRYLEFVEPALPVLKAIANKITNDPEFAKDMVQEATLKIISMAERWDKSKKVTKRNYAVMVGKRRMISMVRSENVRKRHHRIEELVTKTKAGRRVTVMKQEERNWAPEKPSGEDTLKTLFESLERKGVSKKYIERFSFYLSTEGLKDRYYQTAEHFGIPIGTVKSSIWAVRKDLKKELETEARP